jgi:hypothetical protein
MVKKKKCGQSVLELPEYEPGMLSLNPLLPVRPSQSPKSIFSRYPYLNFILFQTKQSSTYLQSLATGWTIKRSEVRSPA